MNRKQFTHMTYMREFFTLLLLLFCTLQMQGADVLVETESFSHKGGWKLDQQFMDQMGSPYLLAHGMGVPVEDARTEVSFPEKGVYYVYVRTYNWTSPWFQGAGPGAFTLSVDGKKLKTTLGTEGSEWKWQAAGKVKVNKLNAEVRLHDLTGFDGRCDAIFFTTEEGKVPPATGFRAKVTAKEAGEFDLVVVGAGIAGMSAAVSAARLGCRVALINDRPVVGGNNSSEIRVHLGGRIEAGTYKELGGMQKEFGPLKGGNAQPAATYEDQKKMDWLAAEPNVKLFLNYRAIAVEKEGDRIASVRAKHIETGEELIFRAPVFSDCTGDGTVGYLAGADFRMGREGRDEFGESTAPEKGDKMTMGSSVQWYSEEEQQPSRFPEFNYGVTFNDENCQRVTMGEWTWETGMNRDQITEFERIRDYGILVIYSNWSYLKNHLADNAKYKKRKLGWVAHIAGKRESRRLMGDYILKEDDLTKHVAHEDGSFATTWSIDLHYPDPQNSKHFPGNEFKSIAPSQDIYPYPVPYRCLYSRNVENLFMAGRNISVTHVALGTVRVMRTTGMMGEVVGMAATLCKKHTTTPRGIYQRHLPELKALMQEGVNKKGLPNNQRYNEGGTLKNKPEVK